MQAQKSLRSGFSTFEIMLWTGIAAVVAIIGYGIFAGMKVAEEKEQATAALSAAERNKQLLATGFADIGNWLGLNWSVAVMFAVSVTAVIWLIAHFLGKAWARA